jgi:hypothetical protein
MDGPVDGWIVRLTISPAWGQPQVLILVSILIAPPTLSSVTFFSLSLSLSPPPPAASSIFLPMLTLSS